jgi:hypothetical protein
MKRIAVAVGVLALSSIAPAQIAVGTWVKRGTSTGAMTMLVENAGTGLRLTYRIVAAAGTATAPIILTVTTGLDGKDAPVIINGKPSGETMAIRRIDATHTFALLKLQGSEFGRSTSEISPDGRILKVENDITAAAGGRSVGKQIEYWDRR